MGQGSVTALLKLAQLNGGGVAANGGVGGEDGGGDQDEEGRCLEGGFQW